MGFLSPLMLWGAAAAGIPIALHFFFRSRYRRVPWAAMKFLLQSIEQTSRRLRFQELLLLLLRVAVLVLLAVALARPLWSSVGGAAKSEAVDAVFLIDTSYSMGARDGNESRLARAQAAARAILEQLPPHSTVQVVTCADRAELLGPSAASNLDQVRDILDHVELTHLATDLLPGVKEAAAALRRGQSPNKELYLFSDMQKLGWDQQAQPLIEALKEVHEKAAVYLVRCDRKAPANAAIVDIVPQSGVPRPGERVGFAVLVRNTGAEALQNVEVTLTVDGNDKTREKQALAKIDPGETRAVTLTGKLEEPGLRVLTAQLKSDSLEADNRFDKVILVPEQVRILVVDGAPNEQAPAKAASFFLLHALLPIKESDRSRWHLRPRLVSAHAASPAHLAEQDLCILCNCALERGKDGAEALSAEFLDHLNTFVRQGHGLLIFAGDRVKPELYNRLLGQQYGLLPVKLTGIHEVPARTPLHLDRKSAALPEYFRFREDDYYKGLSQVEVWKCLEVEETRRKAPGSQSGSLAALRYSDEEKGRIGRPAVLTHRVAAGEVMLVTTAPYPGWKEGSTDPTWTDWPLRLGMYVPFVDLTVGHLLAGQTGGFNMVAGQGLLWHVAEKDADRGFTLVCPGGKKTRLGLAEMVQGRPVLGLSGLTQAGVYRLVAGPKRDANTEEEKTDSKDTPRFSQPLAVTPDLRESADLTSLTDRQLDERLGFPVHHLIAGADPGGVIGVERSGSEWTPWLLAAVLVLAIGEGLLAWFCGKAW
jgi:hypothetical protein